MSAARKWATREEARELMTEQHSNTLDLYTILDFWDKEYIDDFQEAMELVKNPGVKLHYEKRFFSLFKTHFEIILDCPRGCWEFANIPKMTTKIGDMIFGAISHKSFSQPRRKLLIRHLLKLKTNLDEPDSSWDVYPKYDRVIDIYYRQIAKLCTEKQLCQLMRNVTIICSATNPFTLKTKVCAILRATGKLS